MARSNTLFEVMATFRRGNGATFQPGRAGASVMVFALFVVRCAAGTATPPAPFAPVAPAVPATDGAACTVVTPVPNALATAMVPPMAAAPASTARREMPFVASVELILLLRWTAARSLRGMTDEDTLPHSQPFNALNPFNGPTTQVRCVSGWHTHTRNRLVLPVLPSHHCGASPSSCMYGRDDGKANSYHMRLFEFLRALHAACLRCARSQ